MSYGEVLMSPYLYRALGPYGYTSNWGDSIQFNVFPSYFTSTQAMLSHGILNPNHVSQWNPMFSIPMNMGITDPRLINMGMENAYAFVDNYFNNCEFQRNCQTSAHTLTSLKLTCETLLKKENITEAQKAKIQAILDTIETKKQELEEIAKEYSKSGVDKKEVREKAEKLKKELVEYNETASKELEAIAKELKGEEKPKTETETEDGKVNPEDNTQKPETKTEVEDPKTEVEDPKTEVEDPKTEVEATPKVQEAPELQDLPEISATFKQDYQTAYESLVNLADKCQEIAAQGNLTEAQKESIKRILELADHYYQQMLQIAESAKNSESGELTEEEKTAYQANLEAVNTAIKALTTEAKKVLDGINKKATGYAHKQSQNEYSSTASAQEAGKAIAKAIYDAVDGWGTNDEDLKTGMEQINKDTVMETLDAWNKTHAEEFDGESLLESIYNDVSDGDTRKEYTEKILNALKEKAAEAGVDISEECKKVEKELDAWWRDDEKIFNLINDIHKNLGGKEYKAY